MHNNKQIRDQQAIAKQVYEIQAKNVEKLLATVCNFYIHFG